MPNNYQISVVVPLLNEEFSLEPLYEWINQVCFKHNLDYELIFVNDGSTDSSWMVIEKLCKSNSRVKGISFARNYGKSAALNEAFKFCRGQVVITMDADLQDSPDEIPKLYNKIINDGYDMVSGWKKQRYDNVLTKNIPSKIFNLVTATITKIPLHDFNCGLKAYRSDVLKHIEIYGEMHRYIPFLVARAGFRKIGEQIVAHKPRRFGVSKFGWNRFVNGFLDLLTIQFLSVFGKRPMHFFGFIGLLFFLVGTGILGYLTIEKLFFLKYEMAKRPLFYGAILACTVGMQLFLAGFIAEIVVRNAPERNKYQINNTLGIDNPPNE